MQWVKKILLPISGLLLFTILSKTGECQQTYKPLPTAIIDTNARKDSINPALQPNNIKTGFETLFTPTSQVNGINTEQLNPLAVTFVQDYIGKFGKTMADMKTWGKPYFDMMDLILTQHGLPKELKYLAVIESHLKSNIRSWAGAVGPWQFMPATARNFGLRVSKHYDERTDYFKSTHAASRYLTDLFTIYGDWLLVIAAYNGGPANVNSAIKKAGSRDFWTLQNYLPLESKNHVKKFIATHYIMEGQGGITTTTKDEMINRGLTIQGDLTKNELDSSKTQMITGRYNSTIMIKYLGMDGVTFNRYNPDFDKQVSNTGSYELRLPNDKMDIFTTRKLDILSESIQLLLNPAGTEPPKKGFR